MAYRRSIAARAKFFYQQQQRISPSISNIHRSDNESDELQTKSISRSPEVQNYIQHPFFVAGNNFSNYRRPKTVLQDRRFSVPAGCGIVYSRNYTSAGVEEGAGDKIEVLNDVVGVLKDTAVEVAPAVNEVAVAAADSFFPVAALQYMIDYVHFYTGFDWWASIVVTTLIIRWLQLPLIINQMKSSAKLALLKPHMEKIQEEMENKAHNPKAVAEGQAKINALFKEYGASPFTPFKGLLITAPIFCSFFFAVSNMAENVPSLKDGGILWFTDLSTPDSLYVFPVLTALTFWITVECNANEGMEGNTSSGTMKNVMRAFAAVSVLLTAGFPKAIFCYWVPSNLFSLAFGLVMNKPEVKKFLGIPIIPAAPASTNKKPLSFLESAMKLKDTVSGALKKPAPAPARVSTAITDCSYTPNHRFKSLEKKVKERKTGKKKVIQR